MASAHDACTKWGVAMWDEILYLNLHMMHGQMGVATWVLSGMLHL